MVFIYEIRPTAYLSIPVSFIEDVNGKFIGLTGILNGKK